MTSKVQQKTTAEPGAKRKPRVLALLAACGVVAAFAISNSNGLLDLMSKLPGLRAQVLVQVTAVNLQFPNFDQVAIRIGNPRSTKEGFAEFLLECERVDGTRTHVHAWQDATGIPLMPPFPPVRNTPLNVDAGATEALTLSFWKQARTPGLGACRKVRMNWVDNTGTLKRGEQVLVPQGAGFVSFTTIKSD